MAKYLVETYYNCAFKVSHYLDEISDSELKNLEKMEFQLIQKLSWVFLVKLFRVLKKV